MSYYQQQYSDADYENSYDESRRQDYEQSRFEVDEQQAGYSQQNDFLDQDELVRRGLLPPSNQDLQGEDGGYWPAQRYNAQPSRVQRGYEQRDDEDDQHSYADQPERFANAAPPGPPPGAMQQPRKKSLLIGINYIGSQHALQGCHQDVTNMREFLTAMGYPSDQRSQVVMRDDNYTDPRGPFFPNGHNLLAAMQWLVSEPNTQCFLHYSGHGGQVPSQGCGSSGFSDTIVPYDFERNGQIPSNILHRTLVSALPANSTLFIVLDCCHSGSAVELPYVFRADENGNVSLMDNVKTGMLLVGEASHLIQGGFSINKVGEAEQLLAGATDFFRGLTHARPETDQFGLGESETADDYRHEGMRNVWMYSGCRDDQTSADASIQGSHVGAMSWAFLESMKRFGTRQSYLQVLQNTRQILVDRYTQIPQLSVGYEQDLNYQIRI